MTGRTSVLLSDVQLHRVETADEAAAFMCWLSTVDVLGLDTETTGLRWWEPNFTRTVQFADEMQGWTIGRNWRGLAEEALRKFTGPVVFLNGKFDMHALDNAELPLPNRDQIHDVYVQHCLIDPLTRHGLKDLSDRYIDPTASRLQSLLKRAMKEGGWSWATIPEAVPAYGLYGAMDPVLTVRLFKLFKPIIDAKYSKAYERELSAMHILYRAEKRGIRIDTEHTRNLQERWTIELADLRGQLAELGIANPNANRQIEDALLTAGWEPDDYTATGQAKLDKETFKTILASAGIDGATDIVKVLVEYKQKTKWKASYLDAFLNDQDAFGFVHPDIRTLQARTGRMSITRPALQTLPKDPSIRKCIRPHNENDSLYAIDYDSQEARILIHYAQEDKLASVIERGDDLHCYIASEVYGEPIDKKDKRRQLAKNTLYALMYGAGARKIAATAGAPVADVELFIAKMGESFPGINRFMKEVEQRGKMAFGTEGKPYVTTWGGRDVVSEPDKIYTLVNYLIQGSAADVLKEKLIQLDCAGLADNIIVPVHDELLFSLPQGEDGLEMARKCQEIMQEDSFTPALTCGLDGPYANWGEKYAS